MARDPENRADSFETENTGGLLSGFLADEEEFDRRSLWRLGSWGVASVGAVIVAVLASQSQMGWRREQATASDLVRQSQQIQSATRETINETRRLASAVDTLNGDRDRLYSRLTVIEQGLDSVTGSIARQNSAAASPQAARHGGSAGGAVVGAAKSARSGGGCRSNNRGSGRPRKAGCGHAGRRAGSGHGRLRGTGIPERRAGS